ncbi:MAG: hypothetical protein E7329_03070 [Clostridiales bacterium]|nr:hypothetical protein [Clostridiales bacterium]
MKAVTVYGPRNARMEEVEKPRATGDMLVMKVKRTGVCATDQSIYTGESSFIRSGEIKFPCRFGHEWAGVVEEIGPDVTKFKVGDRVYADNFVSCGQCDACKRGDYMACGHIRSVGTVNCWDGCYAEYMQMPERHVFLLPDELSMDEGALIEPASIAYDAFRGVELQKEDTVAVFGTGAIGMIAAWLAKFYGAGQVIMVGRSPDKLEVALKVGADKAVNSRQEDAVEAIKKLTGGKGANLIVETSGAASALKESILSAARYGRISVVSFYERDLDGIPIDPLVLGCVSMVGAAGRAGNAPGVCEIMRINPVKLAPIITHHIPFENCLDIFEHEEKYHAEKIKAMIDFE